MKCPYCAEEIKDDAVVCRYCQRDFFIVQPMMAKLKAANARVKELERTLKKAGIDPDNKAAADGAVPAKPAASIMTARTAVVATAVDEHIPTLNPWLAVVLTIVILVGAHYLIIILFDAPLIFLRVVSIAVPVAIGFLYRKALDRWLFWDLATGLGIAAVAILLMSWAVAVTDHVPILPQDRQGWIEYAQYAASIGFGFFTGCALRHGLMIARSPSPKVGFLVEVVARFIAKKMKKGDDDDDRPQDEIDVLVKKLESLVTSAIAAGSVAVSVYTGVVGILGK